MFGNIFRGKPKDYYDEEKSKKVASVTNVTKKAIPEELKEIEYYRHDGAAHVHAEGELPINEEEKNETTLDQTEIGIIPEEKKDDDLSVGSFRKGKRFAKKVGDIQVGSLSMSKDFTANASNYYGSYRKATRNTGEEKENLKTLKKRKSIMERTNRGEIRKVLHDPEDLLN
ncbi:MAG: hypothetical protein ABH951_01355 [Patescibacteria group bacterium]